MCPYFAKRASFFFFRINFSISSIVGMSTNALKSALASKSDSVPDAASLLHEDSATLVRTLVLRKLLSDDRLMSRISLQLNHAREKRLALDLGVNTAYSLPTVGIALVGAVWFLCPLPLLSPFRGN